ncbi:23294_t:CDS:1, partial [Racocetra persica]
NIINNKALELIINVLNEYLNLKVLSISGISNNLLFKHPNMLINETLIDPDLDSSIAIDLNFMNMRRRIKRIEKLQKEITEEYSKQNPKRKADEEDIDVHENKRRRQY